MVGSSFVDLDINRQTRRKLTEESSMIVDNTYQAKPWHCVRVREHHSMEDKLNELHAAGYGILSANIETGWIIAYKKEQVDETEK
jgi:hypothetical protein